MSDRNLPEPSRGLAQWGANLARRVARLESSAVRPGNARVATAVRTQFPATSTATPQPSDGWYVWHGMAETQVDPGRWLVQAWLQVEVFYNHVSTLWPYTKSFIGIWSTPTGTTDKSLVQLGVNCPMNAQADVVASPSTVQDYFTLLNISTVVSSETGLTLSLEGNLSINVGTPGTHTGPIFWLGPGQIVATPL